MEDGEKLPLPCAKCGRITDKSLRWIQENTFFTCSYCGTSCLIDKDAATKQLAALQRGGG